MRGTPGPLWAGGSSVARVQAGGSSSLACPPASPDHPACPHPVQLLQRLAGSTVIVALTVPLDRGICALFGADAETLAFTVQSMPRYVWGFIVAGMNILISAYFYSTKRSNQAIILNVMRSLVVNIVVILGLSSLLGKEIVWYTFGIYESIVLLLAVALLKYSERNGIEYK